MRVLIALFFVLGLGAATARADDHDRALEALRAGRILPIEAILDKVRMDFGGTILDVELEDEGDSFVYEVKLITDDGRIMKLDYDATSGGLLRTRQRGHHHGD